MNQVASTFKYVEKWFNDAIFTINQLQLQVRRLVRAFLFSAVTTVTTI